jgi:hypothetical protein
MFVPSVKSWAFIKINFKKRKKTQPTLPTFLEREIRNPGISFLALLLLVDSGLFETSQSSHTCLNLSKQQFSL